MLKGIITKKLYAPPFGKQKKNTDLFEFSPLTFFQFLDLCFSTYFLIEEIDADSFMFKIKTSFIFTIGFQDADWSPWIEVTASSLKFPLKKFLFR